MALDKEFFDSVNIDVVKKKYYNANKVNALLGNIQQQAETMGQENELLRTQLEALNGQKSEIGDTLLSARALAKKIEDQARAQAEETIRQAQEKADAIVREAEHKRRISRSMPQSALRTALTSSKSSTLRQSRCSTMSGRISSAG